MTDPDAPNFLVVVYDVRELDAGQVDALAGEAIVQGESSDGHPSAPVVGSGVFGVVPEILA